MGDAETAVLTMRRMQAAVDNCPERMDAADAEAPKPPRIETAVEFCLGMGAARMGTADICPKRMAAVAEFLSAADICLLTCT